MKRGLAILLLLAVCAGVSGCTLKSYIGGLATSSGKVVKAGTDEPIANVSVTYTSASEPPVAYSAITGDDGTWQTEWLKVNTYTVRFEHPEFASVTMTTSIRQRGADVPLGVVSLTPKAGK